MLTKGQTLLGAESHCKALEYILRSWRAIGVGRGAEGVGTSRRVGKTGSDLRFRGTLQTL